MNKLTKIFGAGLLAGVVLTSAVFYGSVKVRNYLKPTEEFVEAKAAVAEAYAVDVEDVSLYRYDDESEIWNEVLDTQLFGSENGLYPNYVYTCKVDGKEEVMAAIVVAERKDTITGLNIYDSPATMYDMDITYDPETRFKPVYVARIDVAGAANLDIDSVINGIDAELAK